MQICEYRSQSWLSRIAASQTCRAREQDVQRIPKQLPPCKFNSLVCSNVFWHDQRYCKREAERSWIAMMGERQSLRWRSSWLQLAMAMVMLLLSLLLQISSSRNVRNKWSLHARSRWKVAVKSTGGPPVSVLTFGTVVVACWICSLSVSVFYLMRSKWILLFYFIGWDLEEGVENFWGQINLVVDLPPHSCTN